MSRVNNHMYEMGVLGVWNRLDRHLSMVNDVRIEAGLQVVGVRERVRVRVGIERR